MCGGEGQAAAACGGEGQAAAAPGGRTARVHAVKVRRVQLTMRLGLLPAKYTAHTRGVDNGEIFL